MEVVVENLQKKVPLNLPPLVRAAKAVLQHEGAGEASLSIAFVSAQKIRSLNRRYLRRDYVTDVLAFDTFDIAICAETAVKNSKMYGTPPAQEITLYIIHGILHLLGYDDHAPADIRKMRAKEKELLDYLKRRKFLR